MLRFIFSASRTVLPVHRSFHLPSRVLFCQSFSVLSDVSSDIPHDVCNLILQRFTGRGIYQQNVVKLNYPTSMEVRSYITHQEVSSANFKNNFYIIITIPHRNTNQNLKSCLTKSFFGVERPSFCALKVPETSNALHDTRYERIM